MQFIYAELQLLSTVLKNSLKSVLNFLKFLYERGAVELNFHGCKLNVSLIMNNIILYYLLSIQSASKFPS